MSSPLRAVARSMASSGIWRFNLGGSLCGSPHVTVGGLVRACAFFRTAVGSASDPTSLVNMRQEVKRHHRDPCPRTAARRGRSLGPSTSAKRHNQMKAEGEPNPMKKLTTVERSSELELAVTRTFKCAGAHLIRGLDQTRTFQTVVGTEVVWTVLPFLRDGRSCRVRVPSRIRPSCVRAANGILRQVP